MGSRLRENVSHIYECFCEVAKPIGTSEAEIIQKFPDRFKDEELLRSVPKFAYPCQFDNSVVQHYSFVLTSLDSKWTFGFCRHDPKSETALVVLSFLPWHEVFYRLLNNLSELLHGSHSDRLLSFLNTVYLSRPPDPSQTLSFPLYPDAPQVFNCQAPKAFQLASIPENRNLSEYYNAVEAETMVGVFAAMLSERRIVFTSRKLSRLSGCVQAANALLYPMSWQHIYIPVLPEHLVDYLLAPMPYLIGVPQSLVHMVDKPDVGEVVVVDTDAGTLRTPQDDVSSLPHSIVKQLRSDLRNKSLLLGDGVSRAFLRALVALIGGYRDALRFHQGEKITFDQVAFVESRPPSLQPFLTKMLELQIFHQFIDERLILLNAGLGVSDEFELETCNYSDKGNSRFKAQYKDWTHTVKKEGTAFIKTVKTKANPAVKSAVKTVKDRGKDVKQAYKGIKSRLRDQLTDDRVSRNRSSAAYTKQTSHVPSHSVTCSSPEPPSLDMDLMSDLDLQHVLYSSTPFLDPVSSQLKPGRSLESFVGAGGNWPMADQDGISTGSHENISQISNLQEKSSSSKDLIDWSEDRERERWPKDSELLLEYGLDFSRLSVGGATSSADSGLSIGSSSLITVPTAGSSLLTSSSNIPAGPSLVTSLPTTKPVQERWDKLTPPPPPLRLNWTKFE